MNSSDSKKEIARIDTLWLAPGICVIIFSPQPSGLAIVLSSLTNFIVLLQSHQRDNLERNKEKDPRRYILVAAHPAKNKEVIQTLLEVRLHV